MRKNRCRLVLGLIGGALLVGLAGSALQRAAAKTPAEADRFLQSMVASIDAPVGLAVHVNFQDPQRLIGLSGGGRYLVHGLTTDAAALQSARDAIREEQLEGVVSVEAAGSRLERLPYSERLVNLLVIDEFPKLLEQGLPIEEVLRVVAPGGTLWLDAQDESQRQALEAALKENGVAQAEWIEHNGLWAKLTRPRDEGMDVWSHRRYDAAGTASSNERVLDAPTGVRWIAGPNWATQHRKRAMQGVTASPRQLVYFFQDEQPTDEGTRLRHALIARDAYNGLILWKRWLDFTPRSALLVTVDDRIYTVVESKGPLAAIDPRTGETLQTYKAVSDPSELLYLDGRLLARVSEGVVCVDSKTGRRLWKHETSGSNLLAGDGRAYLVSSGRRSDGARESVVTCLDLKTGRPHWETGASEWAGGTSIKPILLYNDVLVFSGSKGNSGVSVKDGSHLWTYEYKRIGHGGSYDKILAFDGLVWVHPAESNGKPQFAWEGLNPQTGKVERQFIQPDGFRLRHKCQTDRASGRQILCGALELVDVDSGAYDHFGAARNSCADGGLLPANGLLYTFPHSCHCYPMLRGFIGLATKTEQPFEEAPLETGPAAGAKIAAASVSADWPTFRGNSRRTGSTASPGPDDLKPRWDAAIGAAARGAAPAEWPYKDAGRLSSPVIAGGLVYVAAVDAHRLEALDAQTGEPRWTFTAEGRIDTPPTIHNGLCLFGARGGRVYCLRASDGELVWRRRAAPADERIVAYGQLESSWPVVGGVLVHEGIAYVCTGRHSQADGGIHVSALDPARGKLLWSAQPDGFNGVADLLVGSADAVHMISWEFDPQSGESRSSRSEAEYLRASRLGLVGDSWFRRPIALRKSGQQWSIAGQSGQLLVFDDERLCGFAAGDLRNPGSGFNSGTGPLEGAARLFGQPIERRRRSDGWDLEYPQGSQIRGMVLAQNRLYVAGRFEGADSPNHSVRIVSMADGKELSAQPLSASPIHDGLAVAGQHLYLSLEDGRVLCLGR